MTTRLGGTRQVAVAPLLLLALAAALALSTLAPIAGLSRPAIALGAATDLTLVADTTYTVQPSRRRVHVALDLTARNNTKETKARRFYFDHAFLAVLPGARNVDIRGVKGAKAKVQRRSRDSTLLRIDFGSRLYSGRSRTFTLTFDLVDKGTPVDRQLRVGPSLVTLPVWAHASNGAKGGTVTVKIPDGYEVSVENGRFAKTTTDGGGTQLATGRLSKPLDFFAFVSAQRPPSYAETPLSVPAGDETIALTLRGWKDDPAWSARVGDLFTRSLPVLRQDIGIPWPHKEPLAVQEAASRAADGYAGLFDPAANRIEVAYWADRLVVVHEAAHGWFNGQLLADRWANEGFAALYASRAAAAIDEAGGDPKLTEALKAAAIPLNEWAVPSVADDGATPDEDGATPGDATAAAATEAYGYAASFALAAAIAERAGDDTLRAVWADAAAGVGAYQPGAGLGPAASTGTAAGIETTTGAADWRSLLDLLEARTAKDFTDLWREWVEQPDQAALLDARAAARRSYERTVGVAGDWRLPQSIRAALRAWDFATAERLMADARTVLAQRTAVATMAASDGLTLPDEMQRLFESGELVEASARAEAERNAMVTIAGAAAARSAETDPLTRIGMLGENPAADLAAARTALAAGDLGTTLAAADDAYRGWTDAWQEGRRRVLLLIALLATILVLGSAVGGRIRHARSAGTPRVGATANAAATMSGAAAFDRDPTPEELLAAATPPLPDIGRPGGASPTGGAA